MTDDATTPAEVFAAALRDLQRKNGNPATTRGIAAQAGSVSHTTVADALAGRRIPTWPTTADIVEALGGDPARFRRLWADATGREPDAPRRGPAVLRSGDRYLFHGLDGEIDTAPEIGSMAGQLTVELVSTTHDGRLHYKLSWPRYGDTTGSVSVSDAAKMIELGIWEPLPPAGDEPMKG